MDFFEFDLTIVGGGLVGLSLARALARSGLRLGLVERGDLLAGAQTEAWDARVYAISPASEAFLRQLGAWPAVADRLAPVTQMRIYGDRPGSELAFSAYDAHVPKLATIVENAALMGGLHGTLRGQPDLTLFNPARCAEASWEAIIKVAVH